MDTENKLSLVGDSLASWFAKSPAELEGVEISTLLVDEDTPRLRAALTAARQGSGQVMQKFTCSLSTNGDDPTVEIELSPVSNPSQEGDVLGAVHSKTEYRASDAQTAGAEWFDHFFDLMDQAVVEFEFRDNEPIVRSVNPAFEKTFGYHAGYIVGESLNEYIVPDGHSSEAIQLDTEIANGNVAKGVYTRQTASGPKDFYCRCLPIGTDGDSQYGLATYTDVTEDQQKRQHLQVLHRVLRHNLRNELTVVLGMADEIATHAESSAVRQAAARITDRAENLVGVSEKARMAQSILKQPQTDTVTDVGQTALEAVAAAEEKWPDSTITIDAETALPVSTGSEIRDALDNLLDNAVTHNTGDPVVHVRVRKYTPIHVTTRSFGQEAVITIEDNGPGIPENERAVVFDGEDMNQLKHGSGFGLWVVRWIVESANGSVNYERTDGWTTVELRLPITTDHKTEQVTLT
ncbi:PAS domain-containing sensor histidine kinase [Haloarcula sediminis]|uniref:PAS domain-containing sensor histidine kinase n=1 Tax=Haloarcula sediminis TaxID=3111777 RepID=UPI002D784F7A|nr:PAS domain-containing sensor histidine kinase [Haloarcula sp. CK38]